MVDAGSLLPRLTYTDDLTYIGDPAYRDDPYHLHPTLIIDGLRLDYCDADVLPVHAVIKQRMQMYNSPYRSCLECGRTILGQEGTRAFYRSFTTQLSMNIPFQSIHFMVYELAQDWLNHDRQYHPYTHVVSGALAGAIAAGLTTPLDVCKTLLNTQERCAIAKSESAITGMAQAARTIHEFRGVPGFFQGLTARIIYQVPSTAISWSIYEFFKYFITKQKTVSCDGYVSSPVASVQVHAAVTSR